MVPYAQKIAAGSALSKPSTMYLMMLSGECCHTYMGEEMYSQTINMPLVVVSGVEIATEVRVGDGEEVEKTRQTA